MPASDVFLCALRSSALQFVEDRGRKTQRVGLESAEKRTARTIDSFALNFSELNPQTYYPHNPHNPHIVYLIYIYIYMYFPYNPQCVRDSVRGFATAEANNCQ
jgi:hypothetical protein